MRGGALTIGYRECEEAFQDKEEEEAIDDREFEMDIDDKCEELNRLVLKDQFGTYQNNMASSYRVVIRKPTPDFSVVCTPVMGRPANANQILAKSLSLRKGGRIQVPTKIERVDGFNGVVTLFCENLPHVLQLLFHLILILF